MQHRATSSSSRTRRSPAQALRRRSSGAKADDLQVTVVCAGERAPRGLRRLLRHAAHGGAAAARQDARPPAGGGHRRGRLRRRDRSGRRGPRRARAARAADRPRSSSRRTRSQRSGWMQRDVVEPDPQGRGGRAGRARRRRPRAEEGGEANVLVIANETVGGRAAARGDQGARRPARPRSFLIIAPQSDLQMAGTPRPSAGSAASSPRCAEQASTRTARSRTRTRTRRRCTPSTTSGSTRSSSRRSRARSSGWLRKDVVERIREAHEAAGRARRPSREPVPA